VRKRYQPSSPVSSRGLRRRGIHPGQEEDQPVKKAFISYSYKDIEKAQEVCLGLESRGTQCWIESRDVSEPHSEVINKAIVDSGALVLVYTSNSKQSEHVLAELGAASNRGIPIFVFNLDKQEPPESLERLAKTFHWLDAFEGDPEINLNNLADEIRKQFETPK
jgi:hypothetical protein